MRVAKRKQGRAPPLTWSRNSPEARLPRGAPLLLEPLSGDAKSPYSSSHSICFKALKAR